MARSAKRPQEAPKRKPVRPVLLAGGLGLMWYVHFQSGMTVPDAPPWSFALITGVRVVADIVGAWVVISLAQLCFALGRLGWAQLRANREREI